MIEQKDSQLINIPFGEIGYITYKRTYARRLNDSDPDSKTEEFWQTVERELSAYDKQLKLHFTEEEKNRYRDLRHNLKISPAGRFMWQLGTKTVDKLGLPSLQNCAFVVVDDPIRPFTWAFEMLMLGSGVGFNIQREHVYQLPKVKKKVKIQRVDSDDADFIIPDTREGWVKLLGKVLKAHFYSGKGFTYSAKLIRSKGALIKGFGGVASGPEELCQGMADISKILNGRSGTKLRPIDCLDIMNIIGSIVVSGNVRRSAQIAIGDPDDIEFLKAKRWDLGSIPNWRAMSNNSVAASSTTELVKEFWDTYEQGEPYGIVNLILSRQIGRTGDTNYPDLDVQGFNPCAEQPLTNFETCCLAEIYLPNISSYKEMLDACMYTYRVCKHSLRLSCSLEETESIVHKNMRMGIGVTGILQSSSEQKDWLSSAYEFLRMYDVEYSKKMGWPTSIKLTTVKPSGTLSLLPGLTPGAHPSPAGPYYIRRIRIASGSPLLDTCRNHGYHIEPQKNFDGTDDKNTMVVSFFCKVGEDVPVADKYGWREQLDLVRWLQANWSDNAVSCTIYYRKEELEDIKQYLSEHLTNEIKSVSFLLKSDHGFVQAPYETISKELYESMVTKTLPITSVEVNESDYQVVECEGGACPIK
jgi:ribonucleoside-triphosphate reductase